MRYGRRKLIPSSAPARIESIAIIGMAGRFPGAKSLDEFWDNLCNGVESVSFFTDEELHARGVGPEVTSAPGFVNVGSVLDDVDMFDASFFKYSARDAELMDPQQRFFLECSWEAFENAGYDIRNYPGIVGVFAGQDVSSYMYYLYGEMERLGFVDEFQMQIANDKDHLPTHVSYKMNLRGPSIAIQTACSTSLVAVCTACQSLLTHQCDMALAGGVAINLPQKVGYFYQEGGIASPDGHTRTFDAAGRGTVVGNGIGIVVLKRLADALADGDRIRAVIKGFAVNNDGSEKVGYTAPSVDGQAEVIATAQALAGVAPDSIGYIEAHGTATALGDPIELAALTHVFRAQTQRTGFCAIGSVKSNMGHLSSAAGVAGLTKTVLALEHEQLPPTLNFAEPNPNIELKNSPFFVNDRLTEWTTNGVPRRAGVSSFGIGGTNSHVVVEEAPAPEPTEPGRPPHLLVLSAKTATALDAATDSLAEYLRKNPEASLADVAYTLQVGRARFNHRRAVACPSADPARAADLLETRDPKYTQSTYDEGRDRPAVFMFPGQGTQYVDMTLDLYRREPRFRKCVDRCAELAAPFLGYDIRDVIYPSGVFRNDAETALNQTAVTQPALFVIEYSLASLWIEWGVYPKAMVGHSIGELVAACVAEVFSLEEGLAIVAARAQLMEGMAAGAMLAVPMTEEAVQPLLEDGIELAAVNAPAFCVLSGSKDDIARLERRCEEQGTPGRRLHTSHAFHSRMMEPIVPVFVEAVQGVRLRRPRIPFLSNVTGTWIRDEEATSPVYWGAQLRRTVRFGAGIEELLRETDAVFVEFGPGRTLGMLAAQQARAHPNAAFLQVVPSAQESADDDAYAHAAVGRFWAVGGKMDWLAYHDGARMRVPLPTYPFERQPYWVGPSENGVQAEPTRSRDIGRWFYVPSWKPVVEEAIVQRNGDGQDRRTWVLFDDDSQLASRVVEHLQGEGRSVIRVRAGTEFTVSEGFVYTIRPRDAEDYERLAKEWRVADVKPATILHLWNVEARIDAVVSPESFEEAQYRGFYSLVFLAQALEKSGFVDPVQILAVATGLQQVLGDDALTPEKATLLGACNVIPQELPIIRCRAIDITGEDSNADSLARRLLNEGQQARGGAVVAYRKARRWVQMYDSIALDETEDKAPGLRKGGVYLITGGLGHIGLTLAEYLAARAHAKLVLVSRTGLPPREEWEARIASDPGDPGSRKLQRLLNLEKHGAEVLTFAADVADLEQMREVVAKARERFGAINGVIHGAGVTDVSVGILSTNGEEGDRHFRPKVYGTLTLQELFKNTDIDFVFLLSSLSAILGGLKLGAYSAANLFLDAFAAQQNQNGGFPWITVDWDAWKFTEEEGAWMTDFLLPHEGCEALRRIMARGARHVVVSAGDLQMRIDQWIKMEKPANIDGGSRDGVGAQHPRPNLNTEYVEPKTETERRVTAAWQEMLGVSPIGIHDPFFDLGGHSLLAIHLVSKLREEFHVDIPVQALFEAPTAAQLAKRIDSIPETDASGEEDQRIEDVLAEVEQMSDDEVEKLLAEHADELE